MIKANELRIGNLLFSDGGLNPAVYKVLGIDEESDKAKMKGNPATGYVELIYMSPIPLTPKWLERCGLPNDRSTIDAGGNYSLVFERREDNLFLISSGAMESEVIRRIEYMHIFQNIYFDLKGEELQIKLP